MKENKESKGSKWESHPLEEEFHAKQSRKDEKMQRKLASSKDRSKYKKTDQDKYLKSLEKEQEAKLSKAELLEGRVLSILPQGIIVEYLGERISCILKGLLKKEKTLAKNLVAVGDFVLFEKMTNDEGIISQVKPRRSILSRADNLSRRKEQIIAANIDQVMITISVVNPPLKPPLVDRYIIATEMGNMVPIIVVNKIDLLVQNQDFDPVLVESEKELFADFLQAYDQAGIRVISVSTVTGEGMEELRNAMRDKASVFSGQSGVGKSSLINVVTGLDLKVREIVDKTKKGSHTTTTTQLIPLSFGGWCIDTPGIKSFGVWDLKKAEVEGYFTEIHNCGKECKFINCTHSHEEDCAVIQGVEQGKISPLRYYSYQALMHSVQEHHLRR